MTDPVLVARWGNRWGFTPTQQMTLWQLAGGREPNAAQVAHVAAMGSHG